MRARKNVAEERRNYLFTWKPGPRWPREELRKFLNTFDIEGAAEVAWSCAAYRKIRPGDHAYVLKQGEPKGIFGRGIVIGEPARKPKVAPGESRWEVLIGFSMLRGDVLWNPEEHFLVNESQLSDLPAPKTQWQNQSSGIELEANAASEINKIIENSVLIGRGRFTPVDEAIQDIARVKRLIEQGIRPDQQAFSKMIRTNYKDRCAVTGCATPVAFEAAHISTKKGFDNNNATNGILLRSDIHALFDRFLITLSEDGLRVEVSPELTDPSYVFLRTVVVQRPNEGAEPSIENIRQHRNQFLERQRRNRAVSATR